jgi:hypothetical protein
MRNAALAVPFILMPTTIFLDIETTWPPDVLDYLERHRELFLAWERRNASSSAPPVSVPEYEIAIRGLRRILDNHLLHGYHCTRLTETEIRCIAADGLQLPNAIMLRSRIQMLQEAGEIEPQIAERLRNQNQAGESNRAGMIWFCFYVPHLAGQSGIERFFRSWGGEALYNSNEDDPATGPILKSLGTPCIIEAKVPISDLAVHSWLDDKMIRRFLIKRGLKTNESVNHDDRAKCPVSAHNIIRIIKYPDPEFVRLTGCDTWSPALV